MTASHISVDHQRPNSYAKLQTVELSKFLLKRVSPQGQLQIHTASYRGNFQKVNTEAHIAAGLGGNVVIAQFLKGGVSQGSKKSTNLYGDRLNVFRPNLPFCLNDNEEKNKFNIRNEIQEIWNVCKEKLSQRAINMLVLDEIGLATSLKYIDENDLISTLNNRPAETDIILTGPSIPSQILELADQVTQLR